LISGIRAKRVGLTALQDWYRATGFDLDLSDCGAPPNNTPVMFFLMSDKSKAAIVSLGVPLG